MKTWTQSQPARRFDGFVVAAGDGFVGAENGHVSSLGVMLVVVELRVGPSIPARRASKDAGCTETPHSLSACAVGDANLTLKRRGFATLSRVLSPARRASIVRRTSPAIFSKCRNCSRERSRGAGIYPPIYLFPRIVSSRSRLRPTPNSARPGWCAARSASDAFKIPACMLADGAWAR